MTEYAGLTHSYVLLATLCRCLRIQCISEVLSHVHILAYNTTRPSICWCTMYVSKVHSHVHLVSSRLYTTRPSMNYLWIFMGTMYIQNTFTWVNTWVIYHQAIRGLSAYSLIQCIYEVHIEFMYHHGLSTNIHGYLKHPWTLHSMSELV